MANHRLLFALLVLIILALTAAPAQEAYCYLREVKVTALSNGVQIEVKADGILSWDWEEWEGSRYGEVTSATFRFPTARLGLDKTLYDVEQAPVNTVSLAVPQNARGGVGVSMTVNMSEGARVQPDLSEDRQTFLLTVHGSRTVERETKNGEESKSKDNHEGELSVKPLKDGTLAVRATKADLHEVVAEVAKLGGISVAVDDAVQRKVSLNLDGRESLGVIKSIAVAYGLALSCVGDVYMLSEGVPTDLPSYRRSATASFPTRYMKAKDATTLLPTFLFKYLHDNPEQNAVVVTAPSQMLDKIRSDLVAIDVPPPMILVECVVCELTDTSDLDTQFRWLYQSQEHEYGANSGTGDLVGQSQEMAGGLASAIAPAPILQAWLKALQTRGKAEVNAHPSMAAVNGKQAEIFIGSQRFIKVTYYRGGQLQERIDTVPVGIRLRVRPWTGGNQEITTNLHVEVSNIVELDPQTGVPRLSTREATSTLRTRDGDVIVIGGLSQRQQEKTWRRVPILGSLPIIGPLFRSRASGSNNTELVILIRPRLLDENGRLPADEDGALREKFLSGEQK
ncbi:MAG: hypothetical protein ABFE08_15910 [Armatimonadia bacterium]